MNLGLDPTVMAQMIEAELPALIERLPSDGYCKHNLVPDGAGWCFTFQCVSDHKTFLAESYGATPLEAFMLCRHQLNTQIVDWHRTRFMDFANALPMNLFTTPHLPHTPRVMIVDDDIDTCFKMDTAFTKLGCKTDIQTRHQELHRKILNGRNDIILLDWRLNDNVTADKVVERATRLINIFSDLQRRFKNEKLNVVTYSSLSREEVELPEEVKPYFNHLDHWPKSLPFSEIIRRASDLLSIDLIRRDT